MIQWTPDELAEMARADAAIDAEDRITYEDVLQARELDRQAREAAMTPAQRRRIEVDRQYRARNREHIAAYRAQYDASHRAENLARWRAYNKEHREERLAYQRWYDAEHREQRNAARREREARRRNDAQERV